MSASWTPCRPEGVVIGDAIALSGRDPSGDPWTLSGRVRARGETGTLIVEWATKSGTGDPPWALWSNVIVRRDRLVAGRLRRHPAHGTEVRTDEAGATFLRSLVAGADLGRLAACVKPGPDGRRVGEEAAQRILDGREIAFEWMLRQLDGRMTVEAARAYVPVVQAGRPEVQEAVAETRRPRLPADHPIYADPEIAALIAALPGAYVRHVRERPQKVVEAVGDGDG